MASDFEHRPVLLGETIAALNIQRDGLYVDCTFGRGGHAAHILQALGPNGRLMALDKDPQAVEAARERYANEPRFSVKQGSFTNLEFCVLEQGWMCNVDGVLLDLGVSSPQLDNAERGFSFRRDGELDMRMDPNTGMSAAQWLKTVKAQELTQVFRDYGEERYAKRIAHAVIKARESQPITRTKQLADIIAQAHPRWEKGKDPATRCFQAIRIFINNELDELRQVLPQAVNCLKIGGRLAVISFHSLEDRIVKRFIRDQSRGDDFPPGLPITQAMIQPHLRSVGKAIHPGKQEMEQNPRARSSVLRVAEKIH